MKEIKKLKAGVIGDPIAHSMSPKIHQFFLEKNNINGSYKAIKIAKEDLQKEVKKLVDEGFKGFNVTLPHKEEIFKLCDHASKTALLTKAVNTVIITDDGKIFGHNSDAQGFLKNLEEEVPDFDLKNKAAFVIGAGGAARAVIYSLIKAGMKEIYISNRSEEKAEKLIADFADFLDQEKCQAKFLNKIDFEKNLSNCDLLVNTTCLGMKGKDELEINIEAINKKAVIYDIVYNPLMTNLLQKANNNGNKIVTGIGMLVYQALVGFEAWFGKKVEDDFDGIKTVKNILTK